MRSPKELCNTFCFKSILFWWKFSSHVWTRILVGWKHNEVLLCASRWSQRAFSHLMKEHSCGPNADHITKIRASKGTIFLSDRILLRSSALQYSLLCHISPYNTFSIQTQCRHLDAMRNWTLHSSPNFAQLYSTESIFYFIIFSN